MEKEKGLVYILTNPCFEEWVKIGITNRSIDDRLKELNSLTAVPLSYRCYALYEVEDPVRVERCVHSIIDRIDSGLRSREYLDNGKTREREFFRISPEVAFGILKDISKLLNNEDCLHLYAPTSDQAIEQEIASEAKYRMRDSFASYGLNVGTPIKFVYDDNIVAYVADDKKAVIYKDEKYSIRKLAQKILIENYGWTDQKPLCGWKFFTSNGVVLRELPSRDAD